MSKPEGYPLPWCEVIDAPYWQVNIALCGSKPGWREYQRGKDMRTIIPEIDALLSSLPPEADPPHPDPTPTGGD